MTPQWFDTSSRTLVQREPTMTLADRLLLTLADHDAATNGSFTLLAAIMLGWQNDARLALSPEHPHPDGKRIELVVRHLMRRKLVTQTGPKLFAVTMTGHEAATRLRGREAA